ncbi:MAG TPA: GIY-YIG nuclease family protein [Thermoplasmatales archaeon]|nr:GIY-YIG nuclease family protein [Thermoplasmata archaeon]HDH81875.1 GIY-YIG nuclease family protein [Thermoplasmatales archaeon]RLF45123.1 MAG: GIY-YIG nuclease family protein [Thermoplasmata archaeon]RLF48452.1 MAG: GIY-YIG nuclease family protein [Thermoplasmata archaeon]RLF61967.1 MAG: GIY-YIG nuclease family protein [Thermoplasmata archaeon]
MSKKAGKARKGTYALIVELKKDDEIEVGRLGILNFKKGYYAYIGSAMGGLDGRIRRHLRKDKKKHWHIDYLLEKSAVRMVFFIEGERKECSIASHMKDEFSGVPHFGSSDCKCNTHLFYSESAEAIANKLRDAGMKRYKGQSI